MKSAESRVASQPVVLLGAGGHAKVLLTMALMRGRQVLGVCDPGLKDSGVESWRGVQVLGGDDIVDDLDPTSIELVNGVGQLVGNDRREVLHTNMKAKGFQFATLIHPAAWVDPSADLAEGVQIMAGSMVQADCVIGTGTIVNTRSSLDHDCHIGAYVHIAPGTTICGAVHIQDRSFVGAGAVIVPGVHVGAGAVIGAGTLVLKNVEAGQRFFIGRRS